MTQTAAALGLAASAPAWAKVNLTLHVTGQRADGYHLLDSLVVRAGIGDTLRVEPSDQLELTVDGPYAAVTPLDARNLVIRAARLLDAEVGRGARLHLTKMLPASAGIGGGSADAAAALTLLSAHWGVPIPNDTAVLGADVPVCLNAYPQRMTGIGENLVPAGPLPPCWLVLVNPDQGMPTPDVFARLDSKMNPPMPPVLPSFETAPAFADWLATQRNDLEGPALQIVPAIANCLAALQDAIIARMSGSGATCFGLFESEARATGVAARIAKAQPGWWVAAAPMLS